jgi:ADP-heptose:LPS heptosyltransferase
MKILLFIPNGLGDVLMSFPAINFLLQKKQEFAVVVHNKTQTSALRQRYGPDLKILERFDGGRFSQVRLLLQIRKFNPGEIYAPLAANRLLNVVFFLLTASRVYLPGVIKRRIFNIHYLPYSLSTYDGHQVNYILDFLDHFKSRSHVEPSALFIRSNLAYDFIPTTLAAGVRLAVGLSCGEIERHKIPRPSFFSEVVNKLTTLIADDITVFVFGVGNDAILIEEFIGQLDPKIKVIQQLDSDLEQVFAGLSKCNLGIAGTTGQGHMMAAVNLPMVVLAGVTNPAESGPYTSIQKVISHNYKCGPCYSVSNTRGCGYPCMDDLDSDLTAHAMVKLLKN